MWFIRPLRSIDLSRYWTLDEINDWLNEVDQKFEHLTEIEMLGLTHENREIHAIRITNEATLTDDRPAIFITAALSAR